GMNSGLSPTDPTLVAAFRSALLHQGAIALAIVVFLVLLWATARVWRGAAAEDVETTAAGTATETGQTDGKSGQEGEKSGRSGIGWRAWAGLAGPSGEAPARRLLRVGFGLLWILDGFLQAQPKMAAGLPSE